MIRIKKSGLNVFLSRFATCVLVLSGTNASASYDSLTPDKTVAEFYKWYVHGLSVNDEPLKNGRTKMLDFVSPKLARQIDHGAGYGADYFTKAQDIFPDWENSLSIKESTIDGAIATVKVEMGTSPESHEELAAQLRKDDKAWKITAVRSMEPPEATASGHELSAFEAKVVEFYRWYLRSSKSGRYPLDNDREKLSTYIAKELPVEIAHDLSPAADYFTKAQDEPPDWENTVAIKSSKAAGDTATVVVTMGAARYTYQELVVTLEKKDSTWKIRWVDRDRVESEPKVRPSAQARSDASAPDVQVIRFYRWYLGSLRAQRFPMETNRAKLLTYISKELPIEIRHGLGGDADYFVKDENGAEDFAKSIAIKETRTDGAIATVVVTLGSDPHTTRTLAVTLDKDGPTWKIRWIDQPED